MLRARQPLPYVDYGVIYLPEVQVLENGNAEVKMVDQSLSNLPDVSVTELGSCLKAGVDLKAVNPKVLGTQSVGIDLTAAKDELNNDKKGE